MFVVDEEDEDEDEDGDDYVPPTKEQSAAVERVMKKKTASGRLGVKQGSSDAQILESFIKTAKAIHPEFNPHSSAEDAFNRK